MSTVVGGDVVMICPGCGQLMGYIDEDHFYRCQACGGEYWMPDETVTCPACSKPMRYFPPGCYRCHDCGGEYWPGTTGEQGLAIWRDPAKPRSEPPEDMTARCYHKGSVEYSSPSKGRKRKKPPKAVRIDGNLLET